MAYVDVIRLWRDINWVTFSLSVISITILLTFKLYINGKISKRFKNNTPFPIELLVVIGGTVVSHYLNLRGEKYNVQVVGHIPRG